MSSQRSPITRLYQAQVEASPFIRAFILRDTRDCGLRGDQLLNRFPASSHCVLTWFLEGEVELLASAAAHLAQSRRRAQLHGDVLPGCIPRPVRHRPGAAAKPLGDARSVLPARGLALVDAVFGAQSDAERQAIVERTPAQLARDVEREEADWIYRLEFPDD
jgi:hypothetical protein